MNNELLLLSGNDIPFPAAQVNIHQPTIKEIAYISEESFFVGCELLRFSKNNLSEEDKINLESHTDFDIIMSIMNDKINPNFQKSSVSAKLVLALMFPNYGIITKKDSINFFDDGQNHVFSIDNKNYDAFKDILVSMFCLQKEEEKQQYNPQSELAKKIADKLKKGRQKVQAQKAAENGGKAEKIAVLSRYISILSVGEHKDMNSLLHYTVYQLFDEFNRFELKMNYDIYVKAKMAGAKDLKEVENWMKDIHS